MVCVGLFQSRDDQEYRAKFHLLVATHAPFFDTLGIGRQRRGERSYGIKPDYPGRTALGGVQPAELIICHYADDFNSIPVYALLRLVPFVSRADMHQPPVCQRVVSFWPDCDTRGPLSLPL